MAPPTNLQIDLEKRIAILEDRARPKDRVILGAILAAILAGAGWWGFYVTTNIIAMKQQLIDGGNKAIVASLTNPKSPAILRADLATVMASVQTARAQGLKANPEKTLPISKALYTVIKNPAAPSEAWQAASQLIDYRSQSQGQLELLPCIFPPFEATIPDAGGDGISAEATAHDCKLVIDDPVQLALIYKSSEQSRIVRGIPIENVFVHWNLTNVQVVYEGRPIPPGTITANNCSYVFTLESQPAPSGRKMIEGLLLAENIDKINLPLPKMLVS